DDRDPANGALTFARVPPAGGTVTIDVAAREGGEERPLTLPSTRPGDGVRRVLVVWWDGATWSVALPLAEVGRLPALRALMRGGTSALLDSTEPSTAKALRNLTVLGRTGSYTLRDLAADALRELKSTAELDPLVDDRLVRLLARPEETIWD